MAVYMDKQLGNYRLLRSLGRGAFAEVYLGEHIHLGTFAAIKVLSGLSEGCRSDDFRGEAQIIAHLHHPHIVRVLDFGVESNQPFLVMDYVPNGTLRQRYPQGTILPLFAVVSYTKQIAQALQYAHDHQITHRDVKPENMLLDINNQVLLSDFGISAIEHTTSSLTTLKRVSTGLTFLRRLPVRIRVASADRGSTDSVDSLPA
jgi:eukaryotic-like serine/threonine-protein kinase